MERIATLRGRRRPPEPEGSASRSRLQQLAVIGWLLTAAGASVGLAIATASLPDLRAFVFQNAATEEARRTLLAWVLGGAATALAFGAVMALPSGVDLVRVDRMARMAAPLIGVGPLPILFDWTVFDGREDVLILAGTAWGLGMERAFRLALDGFGWDRVDVLARPARLGRAQTWLPALGAAVTTAGVAFHFSYFTILNHYSLRTSSFDLAIFDNIFWNLLRGEWFRATPVLGLEGSHISHHATFIAYLLLPLYALRQQADTLLVIQGVLSAGAAVPLFLLARYKLKNNWYALAFAVAYLLYAPLHSAVFYDFHFLTLAPFFVLWVLYCFETNRRVALALAVVLALLVREDQGAVLAAVALYWLLEGKRPRWAAGIGVVATVYFVVVKMYVMPLHEGAEGETFTWIYKDLIPPGRHGFRAVVETIVTNPVYTLTTFMVWKKAVFLLKMTASLLLLPFRLRNAWVMMIPGVLVTLLTTGYEPTITTFFQYSANWAPVLFYSAVLKVAPWCRSGAPEAGRKAAAAMVAISLTGVLFSYHFGAILNQMNFRGGFRQAHFEYTPEARADYLDLRSLVEMIPRSASVAATEQEAPHVSNRAECYTMRIGHEWADFLLVRVSEGRRGPSHAKLEQALRSGRYGFFAERGSFQLWKRDHRSEDDRAKARAFGITIPGSLP